MQRIVCALSVVSLIFVMLVSCRTDVHKPQAEEHVVYGASAETLLSSGIIEEIEIIPLQSPYNSSFIGQYHQLVISGGDFYIANFEGSTNLLRFDAKGNFINSIGMMGRGPQEYLSMSDFSFDDDGNPIIFSDQNQAVYQYLPNGTFVKKTELKNRFIKATDGTADDYYLYLGFNNATVPYRLLRVDKQGKTEESYLEGEFNVLMMSESTPVFTHYRGAIYLRESLNNIIYKIEDGTIQPAFALDFGAYNVPQEYFEKSYAMAAAEFLFAREFVSTRKFFENKDYILLEAQIQKHGSGGVPQIVMVHGLKSKKTANWSWYNAEVGLPTSDFITSYVQYLTENNEIVCLVDPVKLLEFKDNPLFSNPTVLSDVTENNNYIVLLCKLR